MAEVLLASLSFVLSRLLPLAIVRRDLRRLEPRALERAWPDSSFHSAVLFFGLLCLPVHFIKTRRGLRGVLPGVGWFVASVLVIGLPIEALALIFEE